MSNGVATGVVVVGGFSNAIVQGGMPNRFAAGGMPNGPPNGIVEGVGD
ncbi:hypothetical protein A2U01_0108678, partial [Trifolium medium]|nr:hypothetical protein [Trifolium medium]